MTNLTEQWKQRKLPDGLYYVKANGVINILDNYEAHLTEAEEVLAEVPNFDRWQAVLKYNKAAKDIIDTQDKENTKLKELLMSARNYLKSFRDKYNNEDVAEFVKEIDQVLGE